MRQEGACGCFGLVRDDSATDAGRAQSLQGCVRTGITLRRVGHMRRVELLKTRQRDLYIYIWQIAQCATDEVARAIANEARYGLKGEWCCAVLRAQQIDRRGKILARINQRAVEIE